MKSSWESCTLFMQTGGGGHISLDVVNVMLTDLDPLAFILHFLNRYWIAATLVYSFCEAMAGTLSVASTKYCWQRLLWCILVRLVGLQCIVGIIIALGHFLAVHQP
jgi:hypothetical protein